MCVVFIQVHAPTENCSKEQIDEFYSTISDYLQTLRNIIILMGDFNSKIGFKTQGNESPLGPYGYGTRNNRDNLLLNFAM